MLCLFAFFRLQENDSSRYGGGHLLFSGYSFKTDRRYILSRFALINGPKMAPALLLILPVKRLEGFKRYNLPSARAANLKGSSSAALLVRQMVLKDLSLI